MRTACSQEQNIKLLNLQIFRKLVLHGHASPRASPQREPAIEENIELQGMILFKYIYCLCTFMI